MQKIVYLYFTLLLISGVGFCNAQILPPHTVRITNNQLIYLLCSTDTLIKRNNDDIAINLFRVSNPMGSAKIPGDDEISHKYYIAVSSMDDAPDQYLFTIGNFYFPNFISLKESNKETFVLTIQHIVKDRKVISHYNIKLKSITQVK